MEKTFPPWRPLMPKFAMFFLATFAAWAAHAQDGQQRAAVAARTLVGSPAPAVVLHTIDGKTIDLSKVIGKKAIYLKFWATWCVPCREQMPHLERVYEQAGDDLEVVAIDVGYDDSVARVRELQKQVGLRMPIVFDDGSLGTAFNVQVTPQHIVIGRDGRIQYVGHAANAQLDAALLAARRAPTAGAVAMTTFTDLPALAVGDAIPALPAPALASELPGRKADAAGRPTVLFFLSPWCESYLAQKRDGSRPEVAAECRSAREQVDALSRARPDIHWVGIASRLWTSQQDLIDYRKQTHIAMPIVLDETGELFRRFRVAHEPTFVVTDAQGRIVRRIDRIDAQLSTQLVAPKTP
jgi:thiol-disulfide isomerase/thioredoxin